MFREGCHDFHIDDNDHVMINFNYLDKRVAPEETMPRYADLRNNSTILYDIQVGDYNRVVGIELDDTYWYLSVAKDRRKDVHQEQLFFWEIESNKELHNNIKLVVEQQHEVSIRKWEGDQNESTS